MYNVFTVQDPVGILVLSKNSLRVQFERLKAIKKGGRYPFVLEVSDDCVHLLSGDSEDEECGESKTLSSTPAAVERGDLPSGPSTGKDKPTSEQEESNV